ncbi:ABC transporter ATP-binding protein [Amycolatopsis rubida]|uniref:ABC transporter ATP-binding protein n=1 Tax=Amycolatopsis rubida TaxID=112413 RepID=A0ABX0BKE9_9PSEU|nr:ATP-binding cassette domain-containing protein [Amycolatopsis sp. M39]MYW89997.1 ATP-binding cassette domain-containing protein [Amycolatopsis rubida]NEC54974.1 ABC transporter ATP-binding protein [Amycolatopsis rubida]OAP29167.1 Glutathione import ATP-binding protein GsiA [Amycolatopsis sp. M39]
MAEPVISIRGLTAHAGETLLLHDVSLSVSAGEIVTLSGPSGVGKTTVAMAAAGLERPGVTVRAEVVAPGKVGYLPQQAAETLNPARRVGHALGELVGLDAGRLSREQRRERVAEVLRLVAFEAADGLLRRYPFEFSGGQRTRLALAQVLATRPGALVLDEPTTGLDAVSKAGLLRQLRALADAGAALLVVTHDPDVAATRTLRLRDGTLTDEPPPTAMPLPRTVERGARVAELRGVSVHYGRMEVLRDVDLSLFAGETVGVVGPSGAGKTSLARCLAGLAPVRGEVFADGKPVPLLRKRTARQTAYVQYVWQEAASSFDPRRTVLDQVAATAVRLRGLRPADATGEAGEVLIGLGLTEAQAGRRPAGLSGGQLQRAALARALLAEPRVLICDEVTTGLDAELAVRVLDCLDAYQRRTSAALLLISHDTRALAARADRIVAVEHGRVVDSG